MRSWRMHMHLAATRPRWRWDWWYIACLESFPKGTSANHLSASPQTGLRELHFKWNLWACSQSVRVNLERPNQYRSAEIGNENQFLSIGSPTSLKSRFSRSQHFRSLHSPISRFWCSPPGKGWLVKGLWSEVGLWYSWHYAQWLTTKTWEYRPEAFHLITYRKSHYFILFYSQFQHIWRKGPLKTLL